MGLIALVARDLETRAASLYQWVTSDGEVMREVYVTEDGEDCARPKGS